MSDRRITQTMPVELLRDARGIYGIGITESHDLEALAWSCGIDAEELISVVRRHRSFCGRIASSAPNGLMAMAPHCRRSSVDFDMVRLNTRPRNGYGDSSTTKRCSAPDCRGLFPITANDGGPTTRRSKRATVAFIMACACSRSALSTA